MQKRKNPSKSGIDGSDAFRECVNAIADIEIRKDMKNMASIIGAMCWNYLEKAKNGELYKIPSSNIANELKYFSITSKKRYIDLYKFQMCKSKKGKRIYQKIISNSIMCPACGYNEVSTLDHYLPKTKYPQFSVFPANLIPNFPRCNKTKGTWVAKVKGEQVIHPYFDDLLTMNAWLFAKITIAESPIIDFFVRAPAGWSDENILRAMSHLKIFELRERFLKLASVELVRLRKLYVRDEPHVIKRDLERQSQSFEDCEKNSWQSALYRELARNTCYHEGGHRDF